MPRYIGNPSEYKGICTHFGRVCSYNITLRGDGYTVGSPPAVTFSNGGGAAATAIVGADGGIDGLLFTSAGSGVTLLTTAIIAAPGGGATRATVTIINNIFSNLVNNIFPYDALEAQAVLGDAALNESIIGRAIRGRNGVVKADDVVISDANGNTRSLNAIHLGDLHPIPVTRIHSTNTEVTHGQLEVWW